MAYQKLRIIVVLNTVCSVLLQTPSNHKIRIKLKSYWVPLIEDSCKQILEAARTTNAKTVGPVPLPTKRRVYCVLKSPHKHKDAREHFEIRTHQRLIDIVQPTADTVDSLMQIDFPAGVDVKVKV
jgi:small subunit ribosomal protein S10